MSRLYIGNVPSTLKPEELRNLFEDCGKIKYFNIQEGSGYMVRKTIFFNIQKFLKKFQEYETAEEAEEAIKKLNGKQFENTSLIVEHTRKIFPRKRNINIRPKRYKRPPSSRSNSSR